MFDGLLRPFWLLKADRVAHQIRSSPQHNGLSLSPIHLLLHSLSEQFLIVSLRHTQQSVSLEEEEACACFLPLALRGEAVQLGSPSLLWSDGLHY